MAPQPTEAWLKTMRIIWLALFVTPVFFIAVLVIHVQSGQHDRGLGTSTESQALLFGALAAVNAMMSVIVPRRALMASIRRLDLRVEDRPGEQIGSFRESAPVRRVVADPQAAVRAVVPVFHKTFIQGMAMAESVALLGMAIAYVGNPLPFAAPFFVVCWVLMVTKLPRVTQITGAIEAATGAECRLGS